MRYSKGTVFCSSIIIALLCGVPVSLQAGIKTHEYLDALQVGVNIATKLKEEVAIVIVDDSGAVAASIRMYGSNSWASDIATRAGLTALFIGGSSADFRTLQSTPLSVITPRKLQLLTAVSNPVLMDVPGGLLLLRNGNLKGAVGVNGSSSPAHDVAIAEAIAEALSKKLPLMSEHP